MRQAAAPPGWLADRLHTAGLAARDAVWHPLAGGRTNKLWKFRNATQAFVCKLYVPDGDNPLFANDATAEATVLSALSGSGLAPELIAADSTAQGRFLVYRHLDGTAGGGTLVDTARLLARLHAHPPPNRLGTRPGGAQAILQQSAQMLRALPEAVRHRLDALRPVMTCRLRARPRLLHGDPVPANIIATDAGLRLIDWQCPALGDPAEDLAIYLSPAMQSLYGGRPLSAGCERRFLDAYGHPARAARYLALSPAFHWRMAVYCLWKAARGHCEYAKAAELEMARLEQIQSR
ncbi:MAG: phosphotransferase [Rhodobacter sp.]|nr:phosphotransferase [Rhodobacter sp.]